MRIIFGILLIVLAGNISYAGPPAGEREIRKSLARPPRPTGKVTLKPFHKGMSSYYGHGDIFHGRTTANGEYFDAYGSVLGANYALTAAHKGIIDAHPEGEWVLVQNLRTKLAVWVWINDAGPYYGGRILDLSYLAACRIGMRVSGVDPVIVYRLLENHISYPVTKRS